MRLRAQAKVFRDSDCMVSNSDSDALTWVLTCSRAIIVSLSFVPLLTWMQERP
jgi:hypothetical protein